MKRQEYITRLSFMTQRKYLLPSSPILISNLNQPDAICPDELCKVEAEKPSGPIVASLVPRALIARPSVAMWL